MYKAMESLNNVHAALDLDFESDRLVEYYDRWAARYDDDVSALEYEGPASIVRFFAGRVTALVPALSRRDVEVVDAGCGTGFVGELLADLGYTCVDGVDLSEQMISEAGKRGVYRQLLAGVDISQPNPCWSSDSYDVTLCCGVFTNGHVKPTALQELIRVTRPGGVIIVSTRENYYESAGFQDYVDRLQDCGQIRFLDAEMSGSYLAEEDAHYLAYKVLS